MPSLLTFCVQILSGNLYFKPKQTYKYDNPNQVACFKAVIDQLTVRYVTA